MEYENVDSFPRVVCVGANMESEVALRGLIDIGANIVGLVTVPSGEQVSISDYVDLHPICLKYSIPVVDTFNVNDKNTLQQISELKPDYIFTLGWSQLFKKEFLQLPEHFVVGSHPTPLPEGRGRAPVPWMILKEYKKSAVTLFRMELGTDSGPILYQEWFDIPEEVYAIELYNIVASKLRDAFCKLYKNIKYNKVREIVQDESKASYWAKRTPADGLIDFNNRADEIEKLVRAVSRPYPGAYAYYNGKKIYIWRADSQNILPYSGCIGQILTCQENKILVQAYDGPLWLSEFSDDNDSISASFFKIGSKFNYSVYDEIYKLWSEIEDLKRRGK